MKAILLLLVIGLIQFTAPSELSAQGLETTIISNEALVDFPESIVFRLELDPSTQISEATLNYQLGLHSCLDAATQVPVEVSDSTLEWTWVMSRSGNPPPGAQVEWYWTITDTAGNTITTPEQQLIIEDERFDWRTLDSKDPNTPIRLHWYEGDEVGAELLQAAESGLVRLQEDTGIKLGSDVEFFIYGNTADMREALLYVQEWAGGIAFTEYNIILIGVPPSLVDTWGTSTVQHELAHLVIGQFARSCLGGDLPTWLSEGLAVYAEGEPTEQIQGDIETGINENAFQPVRSLNGAFPARDTAATSAYSQSYSLVAYLLETYGQEKMQELLLVLADAAGYDAALEQVYGFNADGLETAWRAAIGAPSRIIPPTPTPILASSIPTMVPLGSDQEQPAPEPDEVINTPPAPEPSEVINTPPAPEPSEIVNTLPAPTVSSSPSEDNGSSLCGLGLAPLLMVFSGIGLRQRQSRRRRKKPS